MAGTRNLWWPITLGVVMIVLIIALTVGWIILPWIGPQDRPALYWTMLILGTTFLALVLVGVVLYLSLSIKEIRLNRRQSNFIDSVTHELKSPIASMKLYLQTLDRRTVSEEQQTAFHRVMLKDLERLDTLINHLLDAARLERKRKQSKAEDIDLPPVLKACAETVCIRYRLPPEKVQLRTSPAMVRAQREDLEMIFRNLVDNAIKYSGASPEVTVENHVEKDGRVVIRIVDNGPGIPPRERRRIFGRFVRLGSELERSQTGTGLGLHIVRTLVKRWKGNISVRSNNDGTGTVFEVVFPCVKPDKSEAAP